MSRSTHQFEELKRRTSREPTLNRVRPRIRRFDPSLLTSDKSVATFLSEPDTRAMADQTTPDVLRGTLDLLILKTLTLEDMHGWGIGQRIQQISRGVLEVNQGSLYPALQRLEQKGWIDSEWRTSDANRRAKYYRLTASGRRAVGHRDEQLAALRGSRRPHPGDLTDGPTAWATGAPPRNVARPHG